MFPRRTRPASVYGVVAPTARPTPLGVWLAFSRFGAPLIAALLLFDVVVWAIGRYTFGVCAAIWCLF